MRGRGKYLFLQGFPCLCTMLQDRVAGLKIRVSTVRFCLSPPVFALTPFVATPGTPFFLIKSLISLPTEIPVALRESSGNGRGETGEN